MSDSDSKKRKLGTDGDDQVSIKAASGRGDGSLAELCENVQSLDNKHLLIVHAVITAEMRERNLSISGLLAGLSVTDGPPKGEPAKQKGKTTTSKDGRTFKMKRPKTRPMQERQARNAVDSARSELTSYCKMQGITKDAPPVGNIDYDHKVSMLNWAKAYHAHVKQEGKDASLIHDYRKVHPVPVLGGEMEQ